MELLLIDEFQFDAIGAPSGEEIVQGGNFIVVLSDDNFAGFTNSDTAVRTERTQLSISVSGQLRLERIGGVVETRMQHTTVSPRCVPREFSFFVKDNDVIGWMGCEPGVCQGETDNPAADDGEVWLVGHLPRLGEPVPSHFA
jgi:hypothetical protein